MELYTLSQAADPFSLPLYSGQVASKYVGLSFLKFQQEDGRSIPGFSRVKLDQCSNPGHNLRGTSRIEITQRLNVEARLDVNERD